MFIEIPDYILLAINMLNNAGYKAYIVGGCVRDAILNKTPNDWDICTSATPDEMCKIFNNFKIGLDGAKHGTVRVIINHLPIEITTFRIDGKYLNNRTPEDINFTSSLNEDLVRRDFTINAMAYSDTEGIIDLYGGKEDIQGKIIRCVGNAQDRFQEDALRIMRALRFASQLWFKIESKTQSAIFEKKHLLKNISAERITEEFLKLLSYDSCFDILNEYADVIKVFLPHFSDGFKKPEAPCDDFRLNLSYILSFSECDYDNIFGSLKVSKSLKKDVLTILKSKNLVVPADKPCIKKHLFAFGEELLRLILKFKSYFGESIESQIKIIDEIILNGECFHLKDLDVSGNDIKALGICRDDNIGNILKHLLNQVILNQLPNEKAYLLQEAQNYIK